MDQADLFRRWHLTLLQHSFGHFYRDDLLERMSREMARHVSPSAAKINTQVHLSLDVQNPVGQTVANLFLHIVEVRGIGILI